MMTLKLRIIIVCLLLLCCAIVIREVKKRHLELKYAITWMLLPITIGVIIAIPGALEWISGLLGIYDVVNMVFFLGFIVLLAIIYSLTVALSRSSERIRKLTQMMALDEYEKRGKIENAERRE